MILLFYFSSINLSEINQWLKSISIRIIKLISRSPMYAPQNPVKITPAKLQRLKLLKRACEKRLRPLLGLFRRVFNGVPVFFLG